VQEHKPIGPAERIQILNLLKIVRDGVIGPQLLFITGKSYFFISGYVNSWKTLIWSDENSYVFVRFCYMT
jgi:hypothetical protein